jgi:SAM-dependent methyltransferase
MQKEFRDAMARLEKEHWWYKARREILETAVDRFAGEPNLALTVGVGFTEEAVMLSRRARLVAIDLAPIDPRCREIALPAQADATELPFKDGAFDAVFMFDVLEHIDADAKVLAELHRVLRPKGKLLVTVPAFQFLFGLQDEVSHHKRRYRKGPLAALVRGAGFEIDYATYFNTLLFPPIAAVRLFRRVFPAEAREGKSDFDMRLPGGIEAILERLFSFERHAIDRASLPFGISILCSARRV